MSVEVVFETHSLSLGNERRAELVEAPFDWREGWVYSPRCDCAPGLRSVATIPAHVAAARR